MKIDFESSCNANAKSIQLMMKIRICCPINFCYFFCVMLLNMCKYKVETISLQTGKINIKIDFLCDKGQTASQNVWEKSVRSIYLTSKCWLDIYLIFPTNYNGKFSMLQSEDEKNVYRTHVGPDWDLWCQHIVLSYAHQ